MLFLISSGNLFHNLDLELKMPCQSRLNVILECAVNRELLTWFVIATEGIVHGELANFEILFPLSHNYAC